MDLLGWCEDLWGDDVGALRPLVLLQRCEAFLLHSSLVQDVGGWEDSVEILRLHHSDA